MLIKTIRQLAAPAFACTTLVALSIAPQARADDKPLMPEAGRTTACMIGALRSAPGFVEGHVAALPTEKEQVLVYTLRNSLGQIVHRQVEVYDDGPQNVSIYMPEGLTRPLFQAWRVCGISSVHFPPS